jgi:hypothetical protein
VPGAVVAQTQDVKLKTFNSPDAAAKALIEAASKDDTSELAAVLGPSAKGILTSGNAAKDRQERQEFSQLAARKNHIEHSAMNSSVAILLIGEQDWPFPVPLVRTGQEWHFDPDMGAYEMRARRIGANELDAIEICTGYVSAQEQYATQGLAGTGVRTYAERILSSPGGKDGLYRPGAAEELVPKGFAMAAAESPSRKPYHGYYFRVLKEQGPNAPGGTHRYVVGNGMIGGFALIAWPAEYGVTGIHTFIISHDGQVFEKDFGPKTAGLIQPIARYDPDSSWTVVE